MATGKLIQDGVYLDHTPSSAVSAGQPVILGNLFTVAARDIAVDELGAVQTEGVFELPKNTSLQIDEGDLVYWDVADDELNKSATGNVFAGIAVADAATADETVQVKINGGVAIAS